jgi:serine-type D-Ala-D-Ala endopeptidase (penicillin-binding protein 7)
LNRLVHTIAWSLLALALAPAGAYAAANAKGATKKDAKPSVVKKARVSKSNVSSRIAVTKHTRSVARLVPAKPSYGQLAGLHSADDDLDLKSSVALVIDQENGQVLLRKNESAVLPIASLTKLMTGTIISDAKLPMDEAVTITQDDVDTEKHTGSRLKVGATLTRGELMHLALMSSENRAAHALGRTYPGGMSAFVEAMNAKAKLLGMNDTRYVEPTGLSSNNQSSAQDLARLVVNASQDPLLSELSTSPGHQVTVGKRTLQFSNTNRLVKNSAWDITLQKTGYISEAGQCLVMQARVAGRKLVMVFLDSAGKLSRIGDAERVRRWVETQTPVGVPMPSTGTMIRQVNG